MDSFEINKILGALLGTALLVVMIGSISKSVFHKEALAENAYLVDVPDAGHGGDSGPVKVFDLGAVLAGGTASKGERSGRGKCAACHTFEKGGANTTGPNLWNIIGRDVASVDGFGYSSAMSSFGGTWDYARIWEYLGNPRDVVKGTAMAFIGLPREGERADVIAWLQTLADNPVAFPEPLPEEHGEQMEEGEHAAETEDAGQH